MKGFNTLEFLSTFLVRKKTHCSIAAFEVGTKLRPPLPSQTIPKPTKREHEATIPCTATIVIHCKTTVIAVTDAPSPLLTTTPSQPPVPPAPSLPASLLLLPAPLPLPLARLGAFFTARGNGCAASCRALVATLEVELEPVGAGIWGRKEPGPVVMPLPLLGLAFVLVLLLLVLLVPLLLVLCASRLS